jgi:hypothetical protein
MHQFSSARVWSRSEELCGLAEGAADDHLDQPERCGAPGEHGVDAVDQLEVPGVPVFGQEGRDVLRAPALGAEDGVAPALRASGGSLGDAPFHLGIRPERTQYSFASDMARWLRDHGTTLHQTPTPEGSNGLLRGRAQATTSVAGHSRTA